MEAPDETLGQMLQVCEQDLPVTVVALPKWRGGCCLVREREKSWLVSLGETHCGSWVHWELDSMPDRTGLVEEAYGHGGRRWLSWRELGMRLANAQLQQEAMGRHKLEARLGALSQRRVLMLAEGEEAEIARLEASEEALEQVCEQDTSATDEAISDMRGRGVLAGKRKRGDELAYQPVRHSLWEQDSLEAHN